MLACSGITSGTALVTAISTRAASLHKLWLLCHAIKRAPNVHVVQAWCWKRLGWATCQMPTAMAGYPGCSGRRSRGSRCDGHCNLVPNVNRRLVHAAGRTMR